MQRELLPLDWQRRRPQSVCPSELPAPVCPSPCPVVCPCAWHGARYAATSQCCNVPVSVSPPWGREQTVAVGGRWCGKGFHRRGVSAAVLPLLPSNASWVHCHPRAGSDPVLVLAAGGHAWEGAQRSPEVGCPDGCWVVPPCLTTARQSPLLPVPLLGRPGVTSVTG